MKKGIKILIILITLSLILYKPLNVKADVVNGWASGLPTLSRVDYRSCTSSNCSTDISIDTAWLENNNEVRSYIGNSTGITIGSNGYVVMVPYYTNKDYLYEVNYYVCSNKNLQTSDYNFEISAIGFSSGLSLEHNYKLVARSGLSNVPLIDELGGTSFYQCNLFTGLISAKYDSAWLGFRIRNTQSNVSGSWIGTIAVEVNQLGLWDGTLSNVIENSGFAKAESVEQVQKSVNRVEEAITGEYDYNDTPSEELEGKEELDNLKNKEEELLGDLDFSGAENIEVTINPETSSFIWNMIERIRNMNAKIILFITSILSLGIIKLILNR